MLFSLLVVFAHPIDLPRVQLTNHSWARNPPDSRLVLKCISRDEYKALAKILPAYRDVRPLSISLQVVVACLFYVSEASLFLSPFYYFEMH